MEADLTPEQKAFVRLVHQFPARPLPVLKIAAAFAMMVAAVALACFGLLMAVAG
jgi:hypothetical protein